MGASGGVRAINALTIGLLLGVVLGLAATSDGRDWLRRPTLLLGGDASASAPADPAPAPAPVAASPAPAPAPSIQAVTPLRERMAQGRLRIGVFGDSMADGLWTALYRDLHGEPGVTVTKFSEVSTGLSRYDYVDIQAKTRRQLDEQPVDAAVLLFGTNDAQGISLDGQVHPFGSPGWKAAYARRVTDLVTLLRSRDVAVYWVGLPRMKRESFDDKMGLINAVVEERMQAMGVPYLETTRITAGADGTYAPYLPDASGRKVLMRANDGIHMSMAGYLRIGKPVAERLRRDAGIGQAAAAPPAQG